MIPVGDFQIEFANGTKKGKQVFILRSNATVKWPGGRSGPPEDSPVCGFHGERCPKATGGGKAQHRTQVDCVTSGLAET